MSTFEEAVSEACPQEDAITVCQNKYINEPDSLFLGILWSDESKIELPEQWTMLHLEETKGKL